MAKPRRFGRGHVRAKLKDRRDRTVSSKRWLNASSTILCARRQDQGLSQPRSVQIVRLDEKFRFFEKGAPVLDLGAAPGGWARSRSPASARLARWWRWISWKWSHSTA